MDEPTNQTVYALSQLIDIPAFQNLTDSFSHLTGISTAIRDLDGTILTGSGWQRICKNFHRQHPISRAKCHKSDTVLANQLAKDTRYNVYRCPNGLIEVAVPILIDGHHIGNLFTGQFFFEKPDVVFFEQQAKDLGFDRRGYLEALHQVPILSVSRVEFAIAFLVDLAVIISNAGLDKKRLMRVNIALENQVRERTQKIEKEINFSNSLINSLPGIFYIIDSAGHIKRWNRNLEEVTGYTQEQISTMNPLNLLQTPGEKRLVMEAIAKVFREGRATVEAPILTAEGKKIPHLFTGYRFDQGKERYLVGVGLDISERIVMEKEKEALIGKLQEMLHKVKHLSGLLPICASCKKIRDDAGYWNQIESYIQEHSMVDFSHSICPECIAKLYPNLGKKKGD